MKTRILTAAVGLPILIALLLAAPLWAAGIAMGLVCTLAAYELMHMALGKTPRRLYFSVMLCAFVLPVMCSLGKEFSWAVGVLLLQPLQPLLQSPALQPAFDQVVPALFGALAYKYYRKNLKLAVWPLLMMSAVFILLPALQSQTSILILPAGGLSILLAWLKYRKDKKS